MLIASEVDSVVRMARALTQIMGIAPSVVAKAAGVSTKVVEGWLAGSRKPGKKAEKGVSTLFRQSTEEVAGVDRLRVVLAILERHYGSPELDARADPLDELFFLLIELKTAARDGSEVFRRFQLQYSPWDNLLQVGREEIESWMRQENLGSLKAAVFIDIARRLHADFGSVSLDGLKEWPTDRAERYLLSLPGVGQKTARCVLLYSLKRDVLPVDAQTYRVGVRLGIVPPSTSTAEGHATFDKVVPPDLSHTLHSHFVALGGAVCQDPTPRCDACPLNGLCDYAKSRAAQQAVPATVPPPRKASASQKASAPTAVDIYAGCGGLSSGLHEAGFRLAYALDWDRHACKTHEHNFPDTVVECVDVRKVTGQHVVAVARGPVDLLAGGPNCQGVSQRGVRNPDDPRNFMFGEYVRLVSELSPRMFLMENVPGLAHRHNYEVLDKIFESFRQLGYRCAADVLLAADYGVPQLRYRFVMIGTKEDMPLTLPTPTHAASVGLFGDPFVNVWDAIGDLPDVDSGRQEDTSLSYASDPLNDFQRYVREGSKSPRNHVCSATEDINLRRASFIPEGGNWKNIPASDLPDRFFVCRMTDHSTTYARLRRDQPGFTITSLFGNITAGAFTHPLSNRALTIREGARLQSFRDRFVFCGPRNSQYRQIGNAVPPLLGRAVGEHLRGLLCGEKPAGRQPRITDAVLKDKKAWDRLPVLTPRFKALFGTGTRWPLGWGVEPDEYSEKLDKNYSLRPEFWPAHVQEKMKKKSRKKLSVA